MMMSIISRSQPLPPPVLECLSVTAIGNVVLNFQPITDPFGSFIEYKIYSSPFIGAAFTPVGTISDINQATYTDITANANLGAVWYCISTGYMDGIDAYESMGSDSLSTIFIEVTPSSLPMGYAIIDWDSPFQLDEDMPAGSEYQVWKEYPAGTWTQVQTVATATEISTYEIQHCSEQLNFQVVLSIPGSCSFESNGAGDIFSDVVPPQIPVVSSVTVDHLTNDVVLNWVQNPSEDTQAYIAYECTGNTLDILDTIQGINNLTFTDILASPNVGPQCYSLAAFDTCFTGSGYNTSPTADICNCTIFLPSISYGMCEEQIDFSWTAYTGWEAGVDFYIIHHAFVPEPLPPPSSIVFAPLDTVAGLQLSYVHLNPTTVGYNVYYIEAVAFGTGFRSVSNIQAVLTPYPVPPDYVYLSNASVTDQNEVTVTLEIDPTLTEHYYLLERYDLNGGNWDEVITESTSNSALLDIKDIDVETDVFPYEYRVITENLCGDIVDTTNLGITILQQGFASTEQIKNILTWTPYGNWEQGIEKYRVHRRIGETGPDVVVAELSPGLLVYEDDVSTLLYTDGQFCYTIEAVEIPSTLLGISHSSFSNELCLSQEPKIWIPNAFVVDGFNNTFRPVISFADFQNYKMSIFSRWGDIIYETNDINAPWDGTMNGKLVQEGSYAYFISVEDGKGRAYDQSGYVLMINSRAK
jgi:gliding motility-associated-like protein